MKKNKLSLVSSIFFLVLAFVFIYAPIVSIVTFSFNNQRSGTQWGGFTFKWYQNFFTNQAILKALSVTLIIAVSATLISVIIGTLAAISSLRFTKKTRNALFMINDLPIINPDIVTAICLFLLFGVFLIPGGYATLLLAHIAFCVPYVLITVYPKVRSLDPNLSEAARDLGATQLQTLFKVILPQIKGSIAAAAAIAFTMSFDDFVISYFAVGDSGITNISIYLYKLKRGLDPTINALTTIIIVVITIIVGLNYIISNRKKGEE
ncbi:MAG: ABC transporter permease [Acholeplasmatales bacterium]|nr:ABC transporter permease [Acholeplasmatales bacterium]